MNDPPELRLVANPQAFMAILNNDSESVRFNALQTLDDMTTCECLRHGIFIIRAFA